MDSTVITAFAPAERSSREHLELQAATIARSPSFALMDILPTPVLVLNANRQAVYANRQALELLHATDMAMLLGQRPGELLNCLRASMSRGGCGTTAGCSQCGAVLAILQALEGKAANRECQLIHLVEGRPQAIELQVSSAPYRLDGMRFVVFTFHDVTALKRRLTLERTFFHDLVNSLGAVRNLCRLAFERPEALAGQDLNLVQHSVNQVLEEIDSQRQLMAAESGELAVNLGPVAARDVLTSVAGSYAFHPVASSREIEVEPVADGLWIWSDPVILKRVLGNMLKNALEASPRGGIVKMSCVEQSSLASKDSLHRCPDERDCAVFCVHNQGELSADARMHVFFRQFSSKGRERGLGTYSMKLLGEVALGGKVWYESDADTGTSFFLSLPQAPNLAAAEDGADTAH